MLPAMEEYADWLKIPIVVAVFNPASNNVTRFLIAGGVGARVVRDERSAAEWYGKLWRDIKAIGGDLKIVHDVTCFPEDNLMELREKIYLATGIPVYRQHIWQSDGGTTYSIFTDSPVKIDIRTATAGKDAERVMGLPIDRDLYSAREYMHITAGETFTLLSQWIGKVGIIWCVDLAAFTTPIASQLSGLTGDRYMLDLLYWGFIAKYWPMMTQDVFTVYAAGESGLRSAYPNVAKSMGELRRKHDTERRLVLQKYSLAHKARTMPRNVSITQFTATVSTVSVHINVRNIFEMLHVSKSVPYITAYMDVSNGNRVRLVRSVYDAPPAEPPTTPAFSNGIVMALWRGRSTASRGDGRVGGAISPLTGEYLWLAIHPNGKYYVRGTWHEDAGVGFGDIYHILDEYISPVITMINGFGRLAFNTGAALERVSRDTVSFQGLNVSISWKQPMTAESFRILRSSWDEYTLADIAVVRPNTLHDRIELTYRKGIYANDPAKIGYVVTMSGGDLRNQYAYLSSPFIAKKWAQNYGGRTCSISMRESDVRIDVIDIREDEFKNYFTDYIFAHLWSVITSPEYSRAAPPPASVGRPVRRLRDADPKLYNLSKYGVSRKYSQICQGPRQPIIVTDVAALPARQQKTVVKYWNFTREKPALYACPNPRFPYLSFITKSHPLGYCMPCCNKRARDDFVRDSCLKSHTWFGDDALSEHVLVYGKSIPASRFSHPPPSPLWGEGVLLASAEQPGDGDRDDVTGIPPEWRVAFAIGAACGSKDPIGELALVIGDIYDTLGEEIVVGRNKDTLVREFTTTPRAAGVRWIEVIAAAALTLWGVLTIVFDDTMDKLTVRVPRSTIDAAGSSDYVLINISPTRAYPIVRSNTAKWPANDPIVDAVMSAAVRAATRWMDIGAVSRVSGWKIVRKYINLHGICYAVVVERTTPASAMPASTSASAMSASTSTSTRAYIAITYSSATSVPKETVETAGWHSGDDFLHVDVLLEFLAELGPNIKPIGVARWRVRGGREGERGQAVIVHADGATLYCYYTEGECSLPVIELDYDPVHVTAEILRRKAGVLDADESRMIGEEQYRMTIYNALVMHIGEQLRSERNKPMRERIIALASNKRALDDLGLSAADIGVIRATLQFTGIQGLRKRLESPFDFDMVSLGEIQAAPTREAAIAIIRRLLEPVITVGAPSGVPMPNVYTVCKNGRDQPFCRDGKLVVSGLEDMLPVLADDMRNPLRASTMFGEAWNNNVIDKMRFTRYGNDRIIAYED